jgi:hypothetical protein
MIYTWLNPVAAYEKWKKNYKYSHNSEWSLNFTHLNIFPLDIYRILSLFNGYPILI